MKKKKNKRVRRKVISSTKPDLNIPIPLELLGSEEDPCFAKLFDPRENECQRCGDSEICAIAMGQKNHLLRAEVEAKGNFKDLEELNIKTKEDPKVLRKSIRNRMREMIKMGGGNAVDKHLIINDIFASYAKDGFMKPKIRGMLTKLTHNSNHIISTKSGLKWNKNPK